MLDLRGEISDLWIDISGAVQRVLRSGKYILGPEVAAFEEEVARYLGVTHAVTVNSGTDALVIGLRAAGIGPGDEVITTAFTFFATAEAIVLAGATPVFVDIARPGFNIDVGAIEEAISSRTKAILPVHVFGDPVDMAPLLAVAHRCGLVVLEDCAQAFGAFYGLAADTSAKGLAGARVGTAGHVAAFSFYPTKNLGAYGDGGLVATDDAAIAASARRLRNHASDPERRYVHLGIGYNSRLDEIQAAILRVKLPHVDGWNGIRREVAHRYDNLLAEVERVNTPTCTHGHVYHQYTVRVPPDARSRVRAHLSEAGIASSVFYAPVREAWPNGLGRAATPLTQSEAAAAEVVSLPLHPRLTTSQQERVVLAVREALEG